MTITDDPVAQVDALVTAVGPGLPAPAVRRRDVVLVTGPWLAGVTAVAAALRQRSPEHGVVETGELAAGEAPTAVVFVVSAVAALTASDCALLDAAAAHTDVVIAAVAKIDVHRTWRDMLADDREILAAHAPRYREVAWVGVAAAPAQGEPRVDDLWAELSRALAEPAVARRNRLRAWESRLRGAADRYDHDAEGAGRRARVAILQDQRDRALRQRRLAKSERSIALRSQLQHARLQLSYLARTRCASVRGELQEDAASITRRGLPGFAAHVRDRVHEVLAEVDQGASVRLAEIAGGLDLPLDLPPPAGAAVPTVPVGDPRLRARRLESVLMLLLGTGFGLGVALTLTRLFAGLAPGWTAAGAVAGAAAGLAVTVAVVGIRRLLQDRAVLDRWVGEVVAALGSAAEQLVATRVLAAEPVLTAVLAEQAEAAGQRMAERVRGIDGELREHAVAAARATAARDRELPALRAALEVVRAALNGQANPAEGAADLRPVGLD